MPDPNCQLAGCIHSPGFVISCGYDVELGVASVGPGWESLVRRAFVELPDGRLIVQVKEKFGTLNIYPDRWEEPLSEMLTRIATDSAVTCEFCGGPGTTEAVGMWIKTACPRCRRVRTETGRWPWRVGEDRS